MSASLRRACLRREIFVSPRADSTPTGIVYEVTTTLPGKSGKSSNGLAAMMMQPDDEPEKAMPPPDDDPWSPLHTLVSEEEVEEVRRRQAELKPLLESKTKYDQTALHLAVDTRNWSMVKLLLELGADVGAVDDDLRTPLHLAAKGNVVSIAALLLDYGTDPWAADRHEALPVHYAADESSTELLAAIHAERMLTASDEYGSFPIHRAATRDNLAGVRWFLDHGASVDCADRDGNPVLFHAIVGNAKKVIAMLAERGADWSLRGESGMTALEFLRQAETVRAKLSDDRGESGSRP